MKARSRLVALGVVAALAATVLAWSPAGADVTITSGKITSFDGTKIAYSLFIPSGASASNRVPVIFMTHGWGGSRATSNTGSVKMLTDAGYAVLTWDSRGFGISGGEANVDSRQYEVRDARRLIDFVARKTQIQLDAPGNPRMGMLGGSYAGGIQLMLASADSRVDAIAPDIAWNDLPYALQPGGVLKLGWDTLLYAAGFATALTAGLPQETGAYAPQIHESFALGAALNTLTPALHDWFDARSPRRYINGTPGIHIPTLLTQGTIDTLFNLNQAIANEAQIRANGAPTKMIFYCGGHTLNGGACSSTGTGDLIAARVLAWFDRYLRENGSADLGPAIEYQTQDGTFHSVSSLPTSTVNATGRTKVVNTIVPTSGGVAWATPSMLPETYRMPIPMAAGAHVLGIPKATISVTGTGLEASLFFKLVDIAPDGTLVVVDDQVAALKVNGLSLQKAKTFTMALNGVAWLMQPGHKLSLEIGATSLDHASTRTPFIANVNINVAVPFLTP